MSRGSNPAPIWLRIPADIHQQLHRCLEGVDTETSSRHKRIVFFRADDVATPGRTLSKLISIFLSHQTPLTLAVVPAWLTKPRWQHLLELCNIDRPLFCWMQHGWRHLNHEPHGKKMEFGPSRSFSHKRQDLLLGFERLRDLMGDEFLPVFTPPWNRCDEETLRALLEMGHQALSRSLGAQPPTPATLPEYPVTVDLHSRKERDAEAGWQSLFKELSRSLCSGFCGVMIHHQRMNEPAFDFLDLLLSELKQWNRVRFVHLATLLNESYPSVIAGVRK